MLVYKDRAERSRGLHERSSLTLADICGLEPSLAYEGLAHTLAIICLSQAVMLGFDSREAMCAWDTRIRHALGEVHRFPVTVAPGTKLESGPATLHLCNDILVLARDVPPAVTGQWKLSNLRRYGAVPNGFIFEGGTRCGYWAGVFFLSSAEGEQISFLFDCIVRGISPTKGPFGLRPVLPDPSSGGLSAAEERSAQEALEALQLEKRLSTLSHTGRPGSGGDDRSLSSSSSETSHSDLSASSRLTTWPEQYPSSAGTSQEAEYQVPLSRRPHYDTPRSLRPASRGGPDQGMEAELGSQKSEGCPSASLETEGMKQRGQVMEASGSEAAQASPAPSEPWEASSPRTGPPPAFFSACPLCGGLKVVAASPPGRTMAHPGLLGSGASQTPAYMNIPMSPPSRQQLHYMGLELQEAGKGIRGTRTSRYAQIDIVAMEAAQRAGAQRAQERLSELQIDIGHGGGTAGWGPASSGAAVGAAAAQEGCPAAGLLLRGNPSHWCPANSPVPERYHPQVSPGLQLPDESGKKAGA
ncbi:protein Dok-7 [Fukomys damarensis]|uniref:protein Dok-7 n=1 Tax=Fukomys damarensis TaxID=885580 RepID=UPI00053F9DCE|nr:protein Dok-7 [Fukomys damarensis]